MTNRLHAPQVDPAAVAARFVARAEADVAYAVVDSPNGALIAATPKGLVRLAYEGFPGGLDKVLDALGTKLSPRILENSARLNDVRRELDEYFDGNHTTFDLSIDWALYSDFGRRVLQATGANPFDQTAGNPRASRAAGRALGANTIPLIVSCHRVIGTSGKLTGYTGGMHRKKALLRLEGIAV